jgi:hypothetical protein
MGHYHGIQLKRVLPEPDRADERAGPRVDVDVGGAGVYPETSGPTDLLDEVYPSAACAQEDYLHERISEQKV